MNIHLFVLISKINKCSYTIKSNNNSNGLCSPKSWVSNVNNNWEEIDRHENDTSLKDLRIVSTFKVEKQNQRFNGNDQIIGSGFIQLNSTGN